MLHIEISSIKVESGDEEGGGSSSCHVFMVEGTSSEHERLQRAKVFGISPTFADDGQ